jgi:hypothetical protein
MPMSRGWRIASVGCLVLLVAAAGGLHLLIQRLWDASDRAH